MSAGYSPRYPEAPPHIRALGHKAYLYGDEAEQLWSDLALQVMDDTFCDAMRRAHPERQRDHENRRM